MSVKVIVTSGGDSSISTTTVPIGTNVVHTGRDSKSTRFVAKAGNASATMAVTEPGYSPFININTSTQGSTAESTSVSFNFQTNAYRLIFVKLGSDNGYDDNDSLTLTTCKINFVDQPIVYHEETSTWEVIANGDPGKDSQYTVICIFTYDPNKSISSKTYMINLRLSDENGNIITGVRAPLRINHAAGSAYVYWGLSSDDNITNAQATMAQNGNPITTYVMSNTTWAITQV